MRNSFRFIIQNLNRKIINRNGIPSSFYNNFDFKLKFTGKKMKILHSLNRIKSKSGLGITQFNSRLKPKPKFRKTIAETAFPWNSVLFHISIADEQGFAVF